MTEQELNDAQAAGQVQTVASPATPGDAGDDTADLSTVPGLEQVVTAMRLPRYGLSAPPTFKPVMFTDQIQFVDDGVHLPSLYAYIDGTWVQFQQSGGSGATTFDASTNFFDILNWNSIDGWTFMTPNGSTCTPGGSSVNFNMVSGTSQVSLTAKNAYPLLFVTGKQVTFDIPVFYPGTPGQTGQFIYLMLLESGAFSSLAGSKHVGFKFVTYGSGYSPANLYGTTSDGTTEASVPLGSSSYGTFNNILGLKLVYTPGTGVNFYINGVLAGSITTNLPDTSANPTPAIIIGGTPAENFNFGRILIQKQY